MNIQDVGMVMLILFALGINYTLRTKNIEDKKMRELIKAYIEFQMNNRNK